MAGVYYNGTGGFGLGKALPIVALALSVAFAADVTPLEQGRRLYERTDYDAALALLLPVAHKDAPTLALIGKSYFLKADFKKATDYFLKATQAAPSNSEYHHWLGKAYGRRAEMSSMLTAPSLASKSRHSFERAVELDPANGEALNDLFEYYLQAPGFLGGGLGKASAMVDRIAKLDPAEKHYAEARLAEHRKEWHNAEMQLRRAVDLGPRQVGRFIDLAKFLARHGRMQESEATFRQAEKIAPDSPELLFERANTYIQAGRNLETARELLKRFLESDLRPEHPSREEALKLLKAAGV